MIKWTGLAPWEFEFPFPGSLTSVVGPGVHGGPCHQPLLHGVVPRPVPLSEREFFIDNLLVRIHYIIVMIKWTGLAPWECEFPFPGSLISTLPGGQCMDYFNQQGKLPRQISEETKHPPRRASNQPIRSISDKRAHRVFTFLRGAWTNHSVNYEGFAGPGFRGVT